jgi:hypothetical protein
MRRITLARISSYLLGFIFLVALSARPSHAQCAAARFNTPYLVFGQQPVGTSGLTQTATLTFTTAAGVAGCPSPDVVTISAIAVSGTNAKDFGVTGTGDTPCNAVTAYTITSSGSCTLGAIFTPTATGTRTATITVTWTDPSSTGPNTTTLNVVGGDEVVYVTTGIGSQVLTVDGTTGAFQVLSNGPVCEEDTSCPFNPTGAVVGPDSKIYMTDSVNSNIWRMNQDGSELEEVFYGTNCPYEEEPCQVEGPSFSGGGNGDLYFNTLENGDGLFVIPGAAKAPFGGPFNAPVSVEPCNQGDTNCPYGGTGTAFDASGNLLAADEEDTKIWSLGPPSSGTLYSGTPTVILNGASTPVSVNQTVGIALNKANGQVYLANEDGFNAQSESTENDILQIVPPASPSLLYTTAPYYTFTSTNPSCEFGSTDIPEYLQFDMTGHAFVTTSTTPLSIDSPATAQNGCGRVWRIDPGTTPTPNLLVDLNAAYTNGIAGVCSLPCGLSAAQAIGVAMGPTQGPTQTVNLLPTGGTYSVGIPVGCTATLLPSPSNTCTATISQVYPAGIYSTGDMMNITFNEVSQQQYLNNVGASSPYATTTIAPVNGFNGDGIVPTLVCMNGSNLCDDPVTVGTSYEIYTTWQTILTGYCNLIPHLLRGDPAGGPYPYTSLVDTLVSCSDGGAGTRGKSSCKTTSSSSCASDWLNSFGMVTGSTAGVTATETITSPTNNATFLLNQPATATFACGPTSIVVACPGVVTQPNGTIASATNGGSLPTSQAGTYTLSVTAEVDGGSPGPGATAQYTVAPCQDVSIGVNPGSVAAGSSTTVTASLQSCTSSAEIAVIQFTLSGPFGKSCGMSQTPVLSLPFILGSTPATFKCPLKIPSGACAGTYTVTAGTYLKGKLVDTTTSSLVVTP